MVAFSATSQLWGATSTLFVGQSYQTEIDATGYHYLSIESVSSTNPSVAVSKLGLTVKATVNAYFSGESTITIRLKYTLYGGQNYQYRDQVFTLACMDTQIAVLPSDLSMKAGETKQLNYSFNYPTYTTPSITWNSSDPSIADISSTGLITAKNTGNVTIYAHSNLGSNNAICNVSVNNSGGGNSGGNISFENADKNWYVPTSDEYHLTKPNELAGLSALVASGNSFKGKTIFIDNDIDLSPINWTTPIGVNSKFPFEGSFDAQNHNINYKIDLTITTDNPNEVFYGLFGYVDGVISNLSTTGQINISSKSKMSYVFIGGIVGKAISNAIITQCCNNVEIEYISNTPNSYYSYLGGIVGSIKGGKVNNCVNRGSITDNSKCNGQVQYNNHFLGGISGLSDGSSGWYCLNLGKIYCDITNSGVSNNKILALVGGVAGAMNYGARYLYSANIGDVLGSADIVRLGGISGVIQDKCVLIDCYVGCEELGDPTGRSSSSSTSCIGILGGDANRASTYQSNYVANDIIKYNFRNSWLSADESCSLKEMRTVEFADKLNSYGDDSHFIGITGLFPLPAVNVFMKEYFKTVIKDITSTSAILESTANLLIQEDIVSSGFLIKQDDGKEKYINCAAGEYTAKLDNLIPNRSYYVRWYAKGESGEEYYGTDTKFDTFAINPITLYPEDISVFSVTIRGKCYFSEGTRYGFFIEEDSDDVTGKYYWSTDVDDNSYSLVVTDLKGYTRYVCRAVVDVDGINYEGDSIQFVTNAVATLAPSDFTATTATFNGEIGIKDVSAKFEYRAQSWPSVIDSEELLLSNPQMGRVSIESTALQLNESYQYRIVAETEENVFYGDWIQFVFLGDSSAPSIIGEAIDTSSPVKIYNLSGVLIYDGLMSEFNGSGSIFIVWQNGRIFKMIR